MTAINSLTQRLYTFLREHGVADPSLTVMVYSPGRTVTQEGEQELLLDIDRFNPDFVLCPYLVSKVPACVYDRVCSESQQYKVRVQ